MTMLLSTGLGTLRDRVLARNVSRKWLMRFAPTLALVLVATACGRSNSPADGRTAATDAREAADNAATPGSAPDTQARFNQEGSRTMSRVSTNGAGQPASAEHGGASGVSIDDQALAQQVRVAISTGTTGTTGVYSEDLLVKIGVTAANGVVTLTGQVGSASVKEAFANRASAVKGVRSVRNELQVVEGAATPSPAVPNGRGQTDAVPQQDSARPNK
jgi:osmotically-inducible protein OsmY